VVEIPWCSALGNRPPLNWSGFFLLIGTAGGRGRQSGVSDFHKKLKNFSYGKFEFLFVGTVSMIMLPQKLPPIVVAMVT